MEFDTQALTHAFFRVIHPGAPEHYSRVVRQRDSLHRFSGAHRVGGDSELVRAFEKQLAGSILLSTPVTEVRDGSQHVTVIARANSEDIVITARAAVVATTASVALRLLPQMPEKIRQFLDDVRYAPYVVAALGIRAKFPNISYIVTPEGPMDVGGTVISPALAAPRATISMRCRPKVVLAGDYLSAPYPYGMEAALRSFSLVSSLAS